MEGQVPVDRAETAFNAMRVELAALTAKVDALASQDAAQPDSDSTLRQILGAVTSLSSQLCEAEARLKPTPINVQAIADRMAAQAAYSAAEQAAAAASRLVAAELTGFRGLVRRVEELLQREIRMLRFQVPERAGLVVMSVLLGWTLSG